MIGNEGIKRSIILASGKKIDKETMHLMQTLKGVKIQNIDKGFKILKLLKSRFVGVRMEEIEEIIEKENKNM